VKSATAEKYTGISVQETFNTLAGFGYRAYTFDRSGFRRFYTGSINLIPVEAAEIKTTTDIVWKPQ
jgi:hypothetical protein